MTRWKRFETRVAQLLGGRRHWSNSGATVDVTSDSYVAQCKEVKRMSLAEIVALAEQAERDAGVFYKAGVVALQLKRGPGRPKAPMLLVVTEATWRRMNG